MFVTSSLSVNKYIAMTFCHDGVSTEAVLFRRWGRFGLGRGDVLGGGSSDPSSPALGALTPRR